MTRELLYTAWVCFRQLSPIAKVGVILFELAWLVQVVILVRLLVL